MSENQELARWLLGHRTQIEEQLIVRMGPAAPRAAGPEAETLRRFRTFTVTALMRGEAADPVLDGLRPNERRVVALLTEWIRCAVELAGPEAEKVSAELAPLMDRFRVALRTRSSSRQTSGKPRAARRAVSAAMDRVSDLFFAIDTAQGTIVDANPAAGALLNVERDALFGVDFFSFAPESSRDFWWSQLDAIAEGTEGLRFEGLLRDVSGETFSLEASATSFSTRARTLALIVLRPALLKNVEHKATETMRPIAVGPQ